MTPKFTTEFTTEDFATLGAPHLVYVRPITGAAVLASTPVEAAIGLNIRPDLARKLPLVGHFDIALVLDDSGSMSQPFPGATSRWAHLLESATHAIDVCRAAAAPRRRRRRLPCFRHCRCCFRCRC